MNADCHMHMILDGYDWKVAIDRHREKPEDGFIRSVLEIYQRAGVTYLRDGGDRWGAGARARELAPEYGITYRTPLAPLCCKGHYGSFIGLVYEDLKEYARLVKQQKQRGADFVKIMISGLMDFQQAGVLTEEGLKPALIRQLIHIAHEEGMAVMAHANGADTVLAAAEAEIDSVEHGAYQNEESLAAMAEAKTVWVPTLSTVGNLLGKGRFPDCQVEKILADTQEKLSQYRGLVAPGTDAGAWAVPHGSDTEEGWLRQAGISKARLENGTRAIMDRF